MGPEQQKRYAEKNSPKSPEKSSNQSSRYDRLYKGGDTSGKSYYDLLGKKTPNNTKEKQAGNSFDVLGGAVKVRKVDSGKNTPANALASKTTNPSNNVAAKPRTSSPAVKSAPVKNSNVSSKIPTTSKPVVKSAPTTSKPVVKSSAAPKVPVVTKKSPNPAVTKPIVPTITKKTLPTGPKSSPAMNDLRTSAQHLLGTTRGAAGATNTMVNKMKAIPGTDRMNKPTSKGGISSNAIHNSTRMLGGEPTRSTPKPMAPTSQGAPRASSSKPPSGGKWISSAPSSKTKDLF
jgi:hypothetical protein